MTRTTRLAEKAVMT